MVICPDCDGKKRHMAHINMGDAPHEFRRIDCMVCKGKGEIEDRHAERYRVGRFHRGLRIAANISLGKAAETAGVTPGRLSSIERGEP